MSNDNHDNDPRTVGWSGLRAPSTHWWEWLLLEDEPYVFELQSFAIDTTMIVRLARTKAGLWRGTVQASDGEHQCTASVSSWRIADEQLVALARAMCCMRDVLAPSTPH